MNEYNIKHLFATLRMLKDQNPKGYETLDVVDVMNKILKESPDKFVLVNILYNQLEEL